MFGKVLKLAGVLLVAGTLLANTGPVLAAEAPGTGPETAFSVPAGMVTIPAGGEHWFAFSYAGDGSQIYVDMGGNWLWPGHRRRATQFTVWTPANVQARSIGQAVTPVGAGDVNSYTSNPDQVWSGSFNLPGAYYVVVDQYPLATGSFQLKVTGSGVYSAGQPMPSSAAAATPAPAASAVAAPAPAEAAPSVSVSMTSTAAPGVSAPLTSTVPSGAGPNYAINGAQGWVTTVPGSTTWYAFQYAGDGSQVTIDMQVYPSTTASFAVWTPANLQAMQAGQSVTPIGAGSANPFNANDLLWSGSFNTSGTYYVLVAQSAAPGGYDLRITGSGVAFGH
jgi:hypothetical protein